MANFPTHVLGAVGAGIVATSVLASADLLPLATVPVGIGLVALGGIFPDVDSDHSDAITLVFDTLAVGVAVPLLMVAVPELGLLLGLGLLLATWLAFRYVLVLPFRWLTVHRGRFHSLPMGALLGVAGATLARLLVDPVQAWLMGGLFALGFVVHLVLDELFSVDLGNRRIKTSFGTALKLFERGDLLAYVGLYGLLAGALIVAPSPAPLVQACAGIELRWLPDQRAADAPQAPDPLARR
jgi:hypothetical protein